MRVAWLLERRITPDCAAFLQGLHRLGLPGVVVAYVTMKSKAERGKGLFVCLLGQEAFWLIPGIETSSYAEDNTLVVVGTKGAAHHAALGIRPRSASRLPSGRAREAGWKCPVL